MIVPMQANEQVIGALSIVSAESRRRYGDADLALATELARRAALAVDNARLHGEAVEARGRAEEANQAKTDFLTVMSHELRTPLNAISGYVELISLGIRGPITEEQREDLGRIQRSQRHLLALINDVLNYARLEGGHVDYRIERVTARALIEDIEPLVRPQLIEKNLRFEVRHPAEDLVVLADREKARQVLLNLLSNSVKFTPSRGLIAIEARGTPRTVEIDVCDSGIGIAPDKLEAIFEPFVQVGRSLSSPSQGTGLGLAISRDLARGLSGDLRAASEEGLGSTFTLVLPRA
jgi:signal transduction histidine kinase